ncbi:MAG: hypothetical protein A3K19_31070 [Lentisphaerae bacterium RIFOXYB12_FULL_65_16]|nr:MAG: hypothetical protein A3K18_26835 [Lentisphaerae bacterium RIFOXYA12_64_32]OGV88907.1 MAG: hypothetical protein A3K19_31070 [Lentisphaerae bacterium RIFOXYB12_FULL_65_16]
MEHLEAAEKHLLEVGKGGAGEHLNAIFRAFHTIKGVAGFLNLDGIRGLAHDAETLLDLARTGKLSLEGDTIELVFGTIDHLRTLIGKDTAKGGTAGRAGTQDLRAQIRKASSGDAKGAAAPAGAAAPITSAASSPSAAADEGSEKAQPKETVSGSATVKVRETIRLDAERVDRLVDAIGELVIAESMVEQVIEQAGHMTDQLHRHMNQLGKISRELQTMGTSLQLVTVRPIFQKLVRLVHDLSRKMNKPVNFVVLGEDTELDKTVVDQIGDPLVHMLRNAIDHGLEDSVETRRQAGKPDAGRVELRAFQRGGNIYIEVEDDGRGLNREAIMAKALKQGLIREGQTVSDREVYNLIMLPGFSTAAKVTEVSGRGVGMDVVKRNIETLRGQIEISSTAGKGTLFSIRLPLTLAIIDGMIVKVGPERYIIPTLSLIRTVKPDAQDISSVLNRGLVLRENNELLTVVSLGEQLAVDHGAGSLADGLVVIVEAEGRRAGLLVDALLGKQQIVIKSLGEMMRQIPGVAGGAIMPDGNVALILDIDGLVRMATSRKEEPAAAVVA